MVPVIVRRGQTVIVRRQQPDNGLARKSGGANWPLRPQVRRQPDDRLHVRGQVARSLHAAGGRPAVAGADVIGIGTIRRDN